MLRQRPRSRGQALVEFALILPLFVLIAAGLFDAGRAIFTFNSLSNAVREGLREAVVHQNDAAIRGEIDTILGGLADEVTVTLDKTDCTPVDAGCLFGISISHQFTPATPGLGAIFRPVITASNAMPVETESP